MLLEPELEADFVEGVMAFADEDCFGVWGEDIETDGAVGWADVRAGCRGGFGGGGGGGYFDRNAGDERVCEEGFFSL